MTEAVLCILLAALAVLGIIWLERAGDPAVVLIHSADYQQCVMVRPAPLLRSPRSKLDYQPGSPS
ncbi:MAG: hypothetical protein ACREBM_08770, partial [Sphingomicrobium sp.]